MLKSIFLPTFQVRNSPSSNCRVTTSSRNCAPRRRNTRAPPRHRSEQEIQLNALWLSGATWQNRSRSTLAHVMACCLTAPSHYLNQYWLLSSEVLWHSPESNLRVPKLLFCIMSLKIITFEITSISLGGQWVNFCIKYNENWLQSHIFPSNSSQRKLQGVIIQGY